MKPQSTIFVILGLGARAEWEPPPKPSINESFFGSFFQKKNRFLSRSHNPPFDLP